MSSISKLWMACCFCLAAIITHAQEIATLSYQVIGGKMVVQMQFNGKTVPMIFDTGGSNAIDSETRKSLNLPFLETKNLTDVSARQIKVDAVNVSTVATPDGKASFNNVSFVIIDNTLFNCFGGAKGLIASDLFKDCTIEIDDRVKEIKIRKGGIPALMRNRQAISFIDDSKGRPVIPINFGKYNEAKVLFDTGAGEFLALKNNIYPGLQNEGVVSLLQEGQAMGAGGGVIGIDTAASGKIAILEVPELSIGAATFLNFRASASKALDNLLGYELLPYGKVTVDYVNQKFLFEPFTKGMIENTRKNWELQARVRDDQVKVVAVWGKLKDQVKPGDIVTEVNGQPIPPTSFCENQVNGLPGLKDADKAVLTLKTAQGIKKVPISKF